MLDHLNLHAQLQTSASSESEELLPSSRSGFWSLSLETGRRKDLSTLLTHNAVSHSKKLPLISGGILVVGRYWSGDSEHHFHNVCASAASEHFPALKHVLQGYLC